MSKTERLTAAFQEAMNSSGNPADDWVQVGRGFLGEAIDHMEWLEKGVSLLQSSRQANARHAEAARATARVAIGHLQAVLLKARTHDEQQRADTAARDWLASIGADL